MHANTTIFTFITIISYIHQIGISFRAYLILRFWQESISQGFYFHDFLGKYEKRALHFAIQELSTVKCSVTWIHIVSVCTCTLQQYL